MWIYRKKFSEHLNGFYSILRARIKTYSKLSTMNDNRKNVEVITCKEDNLEQQSFYQGIFNLENFVIANTQYEYTLTKIHELLEEGFPTDKITGILKQYSCYIYYKSNNRSYEIKC